MKDDVESLLRSKGYQLINGQWFAPSRVAQTASDKPDTVNEPVAKAQRNIADPVRRFVSIKSFRCRLVDRDQVWHKYVVDALRYAGILFEDTEAWLELKTEQVQVAERRQERTEITIV